MSGAQHVIPIKGGGHIHLMRCESCMYGSHFDEPTLHDWAGMDDLEHAEATGQPSPKGQRCACACAGPLGPQSKGAGS